MSPQSCLTSVSALWSIAAVGVLAGTPPTFQMLMSPDCLPDAQRGMQVEQAVLQDGQLRIRTTGAELTLNTASGEGVFRQRIGHQRDVLRLRIEGGLKGTAKLVHSGPGFALARFDTPALDLRANGDSLFLLHARQALKLSVSGAIEPAFHASFRANHIVCDEWGGFGLYCSRPEIDDHFDPYESCVTGGLSASDHTGRQAASGTGATATYDLPADTVVCITICPPKPYDWKRSTADHVVWHWSNQSAYPSDDVLTGWAKAGNTVLLQSEVMLWKDWNLAFEPRLGPGEFARVRETLHRAGMRFIVYTSPYYFLRGTSLQPLAMNSFENFKNWPPGTATGENIEMFLPEIAKVMREYKPDGLYFDGQYTENPAALYLLARRARQVVGEDGILEWHSTFALGPERCSMPAADAYVDFILRGESRDELYGDDEYMRYYVSGYNVHNSIGVICNNARPPTGDLIDRLLAVNGRMHTLAGWLNDPKLAELVGKYRGRLADAAVVRDRVERNIDARRQRVGELVRVARDEHRAMRSSPTWGEPVLRDEFRTIEGWKSIISPLNVNAFVAGADGLRVTGRASTFAYLSKPLNRRVQGFVVKLRRGTDAGASWGPGACVRWPDKTLLRVGLRNDGLVQADIAGAQRLGGAVRPDEWVWLRARWGEHRGTIEISRDGKTFTGLSYFQHSEQFNAAASHLLVGKVPYNGQPQDYTDPGPAGTCEIREVEVY